MVVMPGSQQHIMGRNSINIINQNQISHEAIQNLQFNGPESMNMIGNAMGKMAISE